jgi:hypothetical protein
MAMPAVPLASPAALHAREVVLLEDGEGPQHCTAARLNDDVSTRLSLAAAPSSRGSKEHTCSSTAARPLTRKCCAYKAVQET